MRSTFPKMLASALVAISIAASPLAANADDHHNYGGGGQGYDHGGYNHGGYDHDDHGDYNRGGDYRHGGGDNGLAGALLGLGIGALVGGAIVSSQQPQYAPPPPVYYAPPPPAYYAPPPGAYYAPY